MMLIIINMSILLMNSMVDLERTLIFYELFYSIQMKSIL